MIRKIATLLTSVFAERSHATRRKFEAPVKIWFDQDTKVMRLRGTVDESYMTGETCDLSGTGVGMVLSAIRLKDNYLVGQNRELNLQIDLPTGPVRMRAIGRRYEKVGLHVSTEKYLVGVEILTMSKPDKERYDHFLKHSRKLKKAGNSGFALGVDKS